MTLLDRSTWLGKAYSSGWHEPGGGRAAVIEPATGAELASVGIASPADIATATAGAGLDLARQIPTGIVHINDQTVDDAPNTPFGGIRASGTGARFGGSANLDAFTDTRWVTIRGDIAPYPF